MNEEQLKDFFKRYPAVSISGIAREAGISRTLLSYVVNGTRPMNEEMASKLKPVINKYDGC